MHKTTTHINADKILRVRVVFASQSTQWRWVEEIPEKRGFWGFGKRKAIPSGWVDGYHADRRTEEYVLEKDSKLYKNTQVLYQNSIWEKPYVVIESIGGKYTNTDYAYFATDEQARNYVEDISTNFPHIIVNYGN